MESYGRHRDSRAHRRCIACRRVLNADLSCRHGDCRLSAEGLGRGRAAAVGALSFGKPVYAPDSPREWVRPPPNPPDAMRAWCETKDEINANGKHCNCGVSDHPCMRLSCCVPPAERISGFSAESVTTALHRRGLDGFRVTTGPTTPAFMLTTVPSTGRSFRFGWAVTIESATKALDGCEAWLLSEQARRATLEIVPPPQPKPDHHNAFMEAVMDQMVRTIIGNLAKDKPQ